MSWQRREQRSRKFHFVKREIKEIFLIILSIMTGLAVFLLVPPIAQPDSYHDFCDKRKILGITNGMDVLSSIPFAVIGLMGLVSVGSMIKAGGNVISLSTYLIFFAGLFLTGLGSAWYHLKPTNDTLVWDRLPMTITFTGFFCSVVSELISPIAGLILLVPLLLLGLFSVFYWKWTEGRGRGDLRLYGLFQFLPLLLIPAIFIMYDAPQGYLPYIIALLIFYLIARIFEMLDSVIYSWGCFMSGHTLKHLFSAAGAYCLLLMLQS